MIKSTIKQMATVIICGFWLLIGVLLMLLGHAAKHGLESFFNN